MRPDWSISVDGSDATGRLARYLVSLEITDQAGLDSDALTLTVADPQGQIALPRLGAKLRARLGYQGHALADMGEFVVDGAEISSPPRQMRITAHAADLRESLKERRSKGYEDTTLGALADEVAGRHGLKAAVGWELKNYTCTRVDQTNESDISLLTRLGQQWDALVSVKAGRLVIARRGQGQTVSGTTMTGVTLTPADVTSWSLTLSEAESASGAAARVYDPETASGEWVQADGASTQAAGGTHRLRGTYRDRASAQRAARAQQERIARGTTRCALTLPGRTDLMAESPITLKGFAEELDGRWIIASATHALDSQGYSVRVEGERAAT